MTNGIATVAEWNAAPCPHPRVVIDKNSRVIDVTGRILYHAKCLECLMECHMSRTAPGGMTHEATLDGVLELIR